MKNFNSSNGAGKKEKTKQKKINKKKYSSLAIHEHPQDDELMRYAFADNPLQLNESVVNNDSPSTSARKMAPFEFEPVYMMDDDVVGAATAVPSNGSDKNGVVFHSGGISTSAADVHNEMHKFWKDPGRSLRKLKYKISRKFSKYYEQDESTVQKDSYHYASVVVSDSNSRKDIFTISDDGEMDENGVSLDDIKYDDDDKTTVGEEKISGHKLACFIFSSLSLSLSSTASAVPLFLLSYGIIQDIVDRWFLLLPFAFHRMMDNVFTTYTLIKCKDLMAISTRLSMLPIIFISFVEICFYGYALPVIYEEVNGGFFLQPDGEATIEWQSYKLYFQVALAIGYLLIFARILIIITAAVVAITFKKHGKALGLSPSMTKWLLQARDSWYYFQLQLYLLYATLFLSVVVFVACISSYFTYFGDKKLPSYEMNDNICDPLDRTECLTPFPSSFFLKKDSSTETGFRVNLSEKSFFRLKGNTSMKPGFLNDLDGFSTLGPLLFYIEGMKEGGGVGLQGPDSIADSVTEKSVTLLLDVESNELVHHFAEIDYLDDDRPLVIIQPAQPLKHNAAYAVLVCNAIGMKENETYVLDPNPGFKALLVEDSERGHKFKEILLPTFKRAAPWLNSVDQNSIQLMFDFHTVSADSQLGISRGVRDAVIRRVRENDWNSDVKVTRIQNNNCNRNNIARTIYADINVPWFTSEYGDGQRGSKIDKRKLSVTSKSTTGRSKFVIHVPCSIKKNAVENGGGKEVRAVIDYGHGLFYTLEEAEDATFLHRMADDNGYIIVAMDWRGMSRYDLPLIFNMLAVAPTNVERLRDNIIQGYANKIALIEFIQKGFFDIDALAFDGNPIKFFKNEMPSVNFYGISQGGILGGGFIALLGSTEILGNSILGVPGAPMSLIISRSEDFRFYNKIMLLNFYCNRHVRLFLTMFQMAFDSVDASGHLADHPSDEIIPRVLIQAGIGDSQVTPIAAEILARSFRVSQLPNPFKPVFGLAEGKEVGEEEDYEGPKGALTEIYYKKEANLIPDKNFIPEHNNVHFCVREDIALRSQIVKFINKGVITNPCDTDQCVRLSATQCG